MREYIPTISLDRSIICAVFDDTSPDKLLNSKCTLLDKSFKSTIILSIDIV